MWPVCMAALRNHQESTRGERSRYIDSSKDVYQSDNSTLICWSLFKRCYLHLVSSRIGIRTIRFVSHVIKMEKNVESDMFHGRSK